ncbi:MAG: peptide ABC transporter substrate-binding protein [Lachnospiraceae bacterium]|nr:peptide ABC transporter substrate-binding protein [Lachnospiraceae bacterium]
MKKKKMMVALTAATLCLCLGACGNKTTMVSEGGEVSTSETSEPKSIVLTENWDFESGFYPVITPSNTTTYGIIYWTHNFYDTLVKYTPDGEIVGSLAESWEISEDGLTYTFKLREGVKFSDGTVLTADMVKKSIQASITNLGMYNGTYGRLTALIASMEAPDDSTFIMTLSTPYYAALNDLTMSCPLAIVNPAAFEGGEENAYNILANATNGTGPYMYAGDYDGTTYTFVRNPHYWGEAPEADSFSVKVIPENDAKVLALRNGEIDGIVGASRLSYDSFDSLKGEEAYGTSVAEVSTLTRYLGFNMSVAPFNDSAVREAAAYAIDQQALESAVFNSIESAAETLFPTDRPYCNVETKVYATDVEKAKELLEGAGWTDSDGDGIREKDGTKLEITFSYTNELAAIDNAVLAVKAQLEEVGFSVTVKGGDMMTWYGDVMAGAYHIALWKSTGGAYDPSTVITNINPNNSADPIAVQFAAFVDQSVLDEVDSTADLDRVQEIYKEILTTVADENLAVPLSYTHETFAYNAEKINGYTCGYDSSYVDVANIDLK